MKEEQLKFNEEEPLLSYSKVDDKPLLANQKAIHCAVEHLNKHDAYYYEGLPKFKADKKFKDYYIQEYDKEPTQEDIQEYVERLVLECEDEEAKRVKNESATIKTSLGESFEKILEEEKSKINKENS